MLRAVRQSLRLLTRETGYAATVILTLAVCIAANTATFAIVRSVLLRPLPVPAADEIILLANRYPRAGAGDMYNSASGDYIDRLTGVPALADQALFRSTGAAVDLGTGAAVERVSGMLVTPSFFTLVRVRPSQGRGFTADESEPGNERKVVLSDALARQSGARVGGSLRLNGRSYPVVGIMPPGFLFIDPDVRYWVPAAFTAEDKLAHHSNNWHHVGRLRAGASLAQVQSQVDAVNRVNLDRFPPLPGGHRQRGVPHARHATPGDAGAAGKRRSLPALGRSRVRPVDRGTEHGQPRAGPHPCARPGVGHAGRARRLALASLAAGAARERLARARWVNGWNRPRRPPAEGARTLRP